MKDSPKSTTRSARAPRALWTEARELVHLPRRSPDLASSLIFNPPSPDGAWFACVAHLEDALPTEEHLLTLLATSARDAYEADASSAPDAKFRAALRRVNRVLLSPEAGHDHTDDRMKRLHVSLMALAGNTVFVSDIGGAYAYLIRDGRVTRISQKRPAHLNAADAVGPFTHFVRGEVLPGDRILALTPFAADAGLSDRLAGETLDASELAAINAAAPAQELDPVRAAAAVIVTLREAAPDELPARPQPSRATATRSGSGPTEHMLSALMPNLRTAQTEADTAHTLATHMPAWLPPARATLRIAAAALVGAVSVLASALPDLSALTTERKARDSFSAELFSVVAEVRRIARQAPANDDTKRRDLVRILETLPSATASATVAGDATRTREALERAVRLIDREVPATGLTQRADLTHLAIDLSPQALLADADGFIIADRDPVRVVRVSADGGIRLLLTRIAAAGQGLGVARTAEDVPRFIFSERAEAWAFDPTERTATAHLVALPSEFGPDASFAAGTRELFVASPKGPVMRRAIEARPQERFTSVTLIPKALSASGWRSAAVLSPALYLLATDDTLVRIAEGRKTEVRALALPRATGSRARLAALPEKKLLALLDPDHERIVLLTPKGDMVRQYYDASFATARDAAIAHDGSLAILTETSLLTFPFETPKPTTGP